MMDNPSLRRRNALGGVQVGRINVDLTPPSGMLSRTIQVSNLGRMPEGGHIVSDRQGVLDAIASQSLQGKGGYVQLPAQLAPEQIPAFMRHVDPVLNGQYDTRLDSRGGKQTFVFKKQQQVGGLRDPRDLAAMRNAESPLDLTDRMNPANYPPAYPVGNGDAYLLNQNPMGGKMPQFGRVPSAADTRYKSTYADEVAPSYINDVGYYPSDPYQSPVNMALPDNLAGYDSFKTAPGTQDLWLGNDDWAEMGQKSVGYQPIRQTVRGDDGHEYFTGRTKNTGRRDFNFGVAPGDTIDDNRGRVYSLQGDWPVENAAGQYKPQSVRSTLNMISGSQVPYGESEAKMMAGQFPVSGNSEMGNLTYDLNNPNRPRTWVDSPTTGYDFISGSNTIGGPVDTGDAMFSTWADTAYSKADQMTKADMLSGQYGMPDRFAASTRRLPGATDIADVGSIGYQGAPTMGLSQAPLRDRDANYRPSNSTRLTGPLGYGDLPVIRNYSARESDALVSNPYGVLVPPRRVPSAFQAPVAPIGGMDFQTLAPTSMKSGMERVNMPSAVYEDRGTTPYQLNTDAALVEERKAPNGQVLWESSENEQGYNGLNDFGNVLNAPTSDEVLDRNGFFNAGYSRDYTNNRMADWQYADNGRHIPTAYGKGRNTSTLKGQQQSEKFRILAKADQLRALEKQMGSQPNVNLFDLIPREQYLVDNKTNAFTQAEQLHAASRRADLGFNAALATESDVKGYDPDEIHRELIFRVMNPEAQAIARAETEAYAPTMTAFDNRLVRSFKAQQEMSRRAMYGQTELDTIQRQAMDLPDVQPMRISMTGEDEDGNFQVRQQVMPVDYRDMLQARRALAEQGYGQLQQRIPVAYASDGGRYPVVQVGHQNMKAYGYTNDGKADLAAGQPFTRNNQFYSLDGNDRRVFHGAASLPLTMGVMPSRADNFTPDEAIRIQPAYQYSQADRQNTAGDLLRGDGYVPPGILDPAELARRNPGFNAGFIQPANPARRYAIPARQAPISPPVLPGFNPDYFGFSG